MRLLRMLPLVAFGLVAAQTVSADTYPSRPVSVVVPVPPGAANDLAARLVGEIITAQTGQHVVKDAGIQPQ